MSAGPVASFEEMGAASMARLRELSLQAQKDGHGFTEDEVLRDFHAVWEEL